MSVIRAEDLRKTYRTGFWMRPVEAVRGVSFEVGREKLGIVAESGSGKSMTGRAILRLVPPPGRVTARRLVFEGIDLLAASEPAMRRIRGERIAMVLQDPATQKCGSSMPAKKSSSARSTLIWIGALLV